MKRPPVHRHPEQKCPLCGHKIDSQSPSAFNPTATPRVGDLTMCIECLAVNIFDEGLTLRALTNGEMMELLSDLVMADQLERMRDALRKAKTYVDGEFKRRN